MSHVVLKKAESKKKSHLSSSDELHIGIVEEEPEFETSHATGRDAIKKERPRYESTGVI